MRLPRIAAAALICSAPGLAHAQQVPAINASPVQGPGAASASAVPGTRNTGAGTPAGGVPAAPGPSAGNAFPAGMPPSINPLSPNVPLTAQEQSNAALARRHQTARSSPATGEDGAVVFTYGANTPQIVCAPLQLCELALEPGEVVNDYHIGDTTRWRVTPSVFGSGRGRTTILVIKPTDAGLRSTLLLTTNKRSYSISLVSHSVRFMARARFSYPEETSAAWNNYFATNAGPQTGGAGGGINVAGLDFGFAISGDSPSWRPQRVFTDGYKTYIDFPANIGAGEAPALIGLSGGGGLFASPREQMVNYRMVGTRYVVDGLLENAALVSGVGRSQVRVNISREARR